jgi:hypothetical protein
MTADLLCVIMAHAHQPALADLVHTVRVFCPRADIVLYNSGDDPALGAGLDLERVPDVRRYDYARVAPMFFDTFEWAVGSGRLFDAIVNLETDLLFIRPGYEDFVGAAMARADYLAPNLVRHRRLSAYWRPMRSLRPEFDHWFEVLGFRYLHGAFSPAQVFSRRYVTALVRHPSYHDLRRLAETTMAFSLQEIIFPTLTDFLGLRLAGYPDSHQKSNRYRPYQAVTGVQRALAIPDAHFVHPVRRDANDPARRFILDLAAAQDPARVQEQAA